MEVCIPDDVEPEGPLVPGQDQGATVVPIGVKEEGSGSFSDADDLQSNSDHITTTGPKKKRKSRRSRNQWSAEESTVSSSEEGSSTSPSSRGSKSSTKRSGKKVRRRRGLGDAQSSSAPAGILVDNDHHGGGSDAVSASRGATLDQGGSAPVPAVREVEADDHSSSSSSASSSSAGGAERPLGRRNSTPEVAKHETKRVSIPLLGRRLRLDIKFGHEIVHKEPKADIEHHHNSNKDEEDKKVNQKKNCAPATVEKESQVQAKRHDTNEGDVHHQHHHNPFHFLSNLFHHHHHQHPEQAAKGSMSNEHPVVPQTHNVAPKVEVVA